VKRNTVKGKKYCAEVAQKLADGRAVKTNVRILEKDPRLRVYVVQKIKDEGWSPEQVSGRLKKDGMNSVSHEAIYQWIYMEAKYLYKYLRKKKRPERGHRSSRKKQFRGRIYERISIHDRMEVIDNKERFGDWESDTVLFRKQKKCVSVQYERKSMLARLHFVKSKSADETYEALKASIESLPQGTWKSITFDNGLEGACHGRIRDEYSLHTFFCDPFASWQKGGVENLNGLLRQYLPKDCNVQSLTSKDLYKIQERLNNRPRKSLKYLTPNEVFTKEVVH
jgi:IS30 family transposase